MKAPFEVKPFTLNRKNNKYTTNILSFVRHKNNKKENKLLEIKLIEINVTTNNKKT